MENQHSTEIRKTLEDKISYLERVATDYAIKYANSNDPEDRTAYNRYKFAADQLKEIKTPISIGVTKLEQSLK